MNNNELKLIECPICHKKMKSLTSHLPFIHNISCEEFKKIYPDFGRIQLDVRKKHSFKCEYCDRAFEYKNALQSHIKRVHPEFVQKEVIIKAEGKFECKICGKKQMHYIIMFFKAIRCVGKNIVYNIIGIKIREVFLHQNIIKIYQ